MKKIKKSILLLFFLFLAAACENVAGYGPSTSTTVQSLTVYATKTGTKYHRAGCRYLSKSSIAMSVAQAKSRGLTPCSVCNPPR